MSRPGSKLLTDLLVAKEKAVGEMRQRRCADADPQSPQSHVIA